MTWPIAARPPRPAPLAKARRDERTLGPDEQHTPLPTDVVADAARRVAIVSALYAVTFFVVGPVAAPMSSEARGSSLPAGIPQVSDLQTLVARFGPVPVHRAVHLLRQVCHSLGEAHAGGLIHRDRLSIA